MRTWDVLRYTDSPVRWEEWVCVGKQWKSGLEGWVGVKLSKALSAKGLVYSVGNGETIQSF